MELDRISFHGAHKRRDGVLGCLDVYLVRGGPMREAVIISVILILAVIVWWPKKGGSR